MRAPAAVTTVAVAGTPGLPDYVRRLLRGSGLDLDVLLTSDDADQIGGLRQFEKNRIYVWSTEPLTDSSTSCGSKPATPSTWSRPAGRRVRLEVHPLAGHVAEGLTLLDPVSRVFSTPATPSARKARRSGPDLDARRVQHRLGQLADRHRWPLRRPQPPLVTRPAYVDSQAAAAAGLADVSGYVASPLSGHRARGTAAITAWIHVPHGG